MVRFKKSTSVTPWSRVLPEKRTAPQAVKKSPTFYATRKFFTVFTTAHHLSLWWARSIQSVSPQATLEDPFQYYVPIYASVLQVTSFPKVSQPKPFMHLSCLPYLPHDPAHFILLDVITRIIIAELCRPLSSSIFTLLHSPVTASLLSRNNFLSTLFSNTLALCFSLNVRDQVSCPYKTTNKIILLYILIRLPTQNKNWHTSYNKRLRRLGWRD